MAIYSSHMSFVKRSAGHNAIAKAAYNSRSKLTLFVHDKKTNITGELTWDYTSIPGLAFSKIYAPERVPGWVFDREILWNKAEAAENRKDAQPAGNFILALPIELNIEQNRLLVDDICKELTDLGMIVDANIHNDKSHNPHLHLQRSLRELKKDRYGNVEFSKIKNRGWQNRAFLIWWREMTCEKINKHLTWAGLSVKVSNKSYKEQGIDLEPTVHLGPASNIKNSELVALNKEIIARNAKKVRENPSIIVDKLAANKPVFTKEEVAIEIDKILSEEIKYKLLAVSREEKNNIKDSSEEVLNEHLVNQRMQLLSSIMSGGSVSLLTKGDFKDRPLYTSTKRLEMEKRYINLLEY